MGMIYALLMSENAKDNHPTFRFSCLEKEKRYLESDWLREAQY